MATTTAEVQFYLSARDAASKTLTGVERQLQSIARTAGEISKRFSGGQLLGSILSGVGLGSGAQITQKLVELITRPWEQAAESAKIIERMSASSVEHTKRIVALRRELLGIEQKDDLGRLEEAARSARAYFDRLNAPRFVDDTRGAAAVGTTVQQIATVGPSLLGRGGFGAAFAAASGIPVPRTVRQNTPEELAAIEKAKKAFEDAEFELLKAQVEARKETQQEVIDNVKSFEAKFRDQLRLESTRSEAARKAGAAARQDAMVAVEQTLADFWSTIEANARESANRLEAALDNFFSFDSRPGRNRQSSYLDALRARVQNNPDALSVGEGLQAGALGFMANVGSTGEQVAQGLSNTLGTAVDGISQGIAGWIVHAQNFGEAMRSLGATILTTVVQSLAQIGTQMVVNAILGRTLRKQEAAEEAATTGPVAAKAGLKSIADLGPIFGPIAFAAAIAGVMALAGKFSTGGYVQGPGTSTSDSVPAWLSNGEFVLNAATVQRMGVDNVERLNRGGLVGVGVPSAGGRGRDRGSRTTVNLIAVDSRREADRIRKNSSGEAQVFDLVRRRRHELLG